MLLSGGSTTKAASKTIPVQEERAKVLPKIRYEPDNKQHENDQKHQSLIFIGPKSDHCLPLSLTHSLTN